MGKQCKHCGEVFDLATGFQKCHFSPDGHRHTCRACARAIEPARGSIAYPYDTEALRVWESFLLAYARRTLKHRPPSIIVSVPVAQRAELEAFCRGISLTLKAVYALPPGKVGVVLADVTLAAGVLIFPGFLTPLLQEEK